MGKEGRRRRQRRREYPWRAYTDYLSAIDRDALAQRMAGFRSYTHANPEGPVTTDMLVDVFSHEGRSTFPHSIRNSLEGTTHWRARCISDRAEIRNESDLWEPPPVHAGRGRFNEPGAPLLYTSAVDSAGIEREARVPDGSMFVLVRFDTSTSIRALSLDIGKEKVALTTEQRATKDLIDRFLNEQIFRPATEPGAHVVAHAFLRDFYSIPEVLFDAWLYPSVEVPGLMNVAFRPDRAHRLLTVGDVHLCVSTNGFVTRHAYIDLATWTDRSQPPPWIDLP